MKQKKALSAAILGLCLFTGFFSLTSTAEEEAASADTQEEAVSEDTQEESISEDMQEESISEDMREEPLSEDMQEESVSATKKTVHVCVHDPSIFEDTDGTFYVLGSHTASASSADLIEWKQLNFDYGNGKGVPFYGDLETTLEEPFKWAGCDDGDCSGGYAVWAPDIIYNPYYQWEDGDSGAYMLYLCCSSTWRRSCIAFLVSKEMTGTYTYGDTIVYSGFTKSGETDGNSSRDTSWDNDYLNLKQLTELGAENGGIDEISDNWFNMDGSWNHLYAPNAIDPNLFFDASGEKLYMSYGSWSGGLFLLELDPATGLALYPGVDSVDEASGNYVDRYFGIHLVGGDHQSGEGPYITYDAETEYYYLYCTYGGLMAEGGYNMRLFRSKNVTGPYLDAAGNNAADNRKSGDRYGIKLIGNYSFYNQTGMRAAGHNSQLNASDGSRYLVYHQRFDVKPQLEAHEVRVRQQFMNEDQWPVTAVYEYRGEQPEHYDPSQIAGTYEFVCHGNKTDGDMLQTQIILLEEDGTISGALEGTWEKSDSGKEYDYATIKISDVTYKGLFFLQHKENQDPDPVMTFSAIGDDNTCIWGSMAGEENGEMFASMTADALKKVILDTVKEHGTLPNELMNCGIEWKSADENVITNEGEILTPSEKTKVDLTAVITSGDTVLEQTYHVTVKP